MKSFIKSITPTAVLNCYFYSVAILGAIRYGFPSRKLFVIGITGTKGKSTTTEMVTAILREAGFKVAVASTIRFAIGNESEPNLFKMTMPGRFFLQQFLRKAVSAGATHAVVEMTSEGAKQYRHRGISLDALIFTNLQPEHLESHGGIEKYAAAKLSIAKHLEESSKRPRYIVANADDKYGKDFLAVNVEVKAPFKLADAEPYTTDEKSVRFMWKGVLFTVPLPGVFNIRNMLGALTLGDAMSIPLATMQKALEHIKPVAGRAERVELGQPFNVVVDYAHTPDSLRALYETYAARATDPNFNNKIIAVLGSTGGGRDVWKRPAMGKLADEFAHSIYLTNEDPYDEDPQQIIAQIAGGFSKNQPHIILGRREAIHEALKEAKTLKQGHPEHKVSVLITGKGTDPYIMLAGGAKEPWSDRKVAEEELGKLGYRQGE